MAEASIHFLLESIGHADAQYQQQKHYCIASVEALVKLLGQESDLQLQHKGREAGAELQNEEQEQDPELQHEEQQTALVLQRKTGAELQLEEQETALVHQQKPGAELQLEEQETALVHQFEEQERDPEPQHEEQERALELQRDEQEPDGQLQEEPGFEHQYEEPGSEHHYEKLQHENLGPGSEPPYEAALEAQDPSAAFEKQEERLEFLHSLHIREERASAALQQVLVPELLHWEQETGFKSQLEKQYEFLHEEQQPGPELHQGDEQDEFLDEEHDPAHEETLQTHVEQNGFEEKIPRQHDEIESGSDLQFDQYEEELPQHQKQEVVFDLRHSLQTYEEQETALAQSYEEQEVDLGFRHSLAHDEQPFANLPEEAGPENLDCYQHEDVDEEQKQYEEQEPSLKVLASRQAREEDEACSHFMRSLSAKRKQDFLSRSFQSAQHEVEEPGYQLKHEKQHTGMLSVEQQDAFLHFPKTHEEQPCAKLQRQQFLQVREGQKSSVKSTYLFKTKSFCEKPCLELPTPDRAAIDREPLRDIKNLPQSRKPGPNEGCWRPLQPCREASLQPESTNTEISLKSSNLVATMRSFLPLVVQQQPAVPYANGKKDVRVKALEAAEGARKQEEKRAEQRKLRKMELLKRDKCNDMKASARSSSVTASGVTARSKRPLGLKSKIEQEKSKKLEEEQRKKDEEWKKKEMELNAKKRKKEEVDKKEREDKRRKVGDILRQKKEQEERLRAELDEKEQRRKALEEAERERKATEEDMKRQRRLEKEREIERRRKAEEDAKSNWLAAKEADRKRREETFQRMKMLEKEQRRHVEKNLSTSDTVTSGQQDFYEMQREQSLGLLGHAMRVPRNQAENRVVRGVSEAASFATTSQLPARGTVSMSYAKSSMDLEIGTERYVGTPALKSSIDPRKPYCSSLGSDLDEDDGPTSYEISPYKSSSDEEDEEEERPQKLVPRWARKENLMPLLIRQAHVDPDEIFTGAKSCSLNEVFGTTGNKKRRDFTQRSESGDWLVDMVTWKEELQYKKSMGFLHPG